MTMKINSSMTWGTEKSKRSAHGSKRELCVMLDLPHSRPLLLLSLLRCPAPWPGPCFLVLQQRHVPSSSPHSCHLDESPPRTAFSPPRARWVSFYLNSTSPKHEVKYLYRLPCILYRGTVPGCLGQY